MSACGSVVALRLVLRLIFPIFLLHTKRSSLSAARPNGRF